MNLSFRAKLHKHVGSCSDISVNLMSGGGVGPCHGYSTTPVIPILHGCGGERMWDD